ncbi:sporulation integral membrane protein YtvI [Aquibacillus salsiterrae]|uniref:Sporulation integral membrane protein YtvI n=1 Tax=Aquibacillus salsiterrae TaxID=2950439 RepID=A0A9X4ADP1_9BACI|nr:sporulation integral membrane protein YtvI [Aquibacillus salsiterrae]MDC3415747.1 sporulation integral membrane protein YtvI [Aquibacillus salsiterrae]
MPLSFVNRILRLFLVIGTIISGFIISYYVMKYTYPFIFSILIAMLINPLVNLFEYKIHLPRALSVFLSILLIMAAIAGLITLLIMELISGTTYMAEQIPRHFETLVSICQQLIVDSIIPIYQKLSIILSGLESYQQTAILDNIRTLADSFATKGGTILETILTTIPAELSKLPNYITVFIFTLLGTFFISKDWYKLTGLVKKVAPETLIISSSDVITGLKKALFGFIKAQLTLISITALIVLVGLIILQVEHATTIALIIGMVDLLPYLGTGIIFLPWIIYTFLTGNYSFTIGLCVLFIIVVLQRQLMEPKVLSSNIGLHPLATLVSIFVGFQLWGLLGLIIGPSLLVIVNTLYQSGVLYRLWLFIW